jgi:hypothetical protein
MTPYTREHFEQGKPACIKNGDTVEQLTDFSTTIGIVKYVGVIHGEINLFTKDFKFAYSNDPERDLYLKEPKPYTLESYRAGKKAKTGDGREVEVYYYTFDVGEFPFKGFIKCKENQGFHSWDKDGKVFFNIDPNNDLFEAD